MLITILCSLTGSGGGKAIKAEKFEIGS